jgi:hypothetical protein
MSGALPTTRSPAQITVTSWSPTLISRAQSLKTQRRRRGAAIQRWKLHFEYGVMERTDYLDLYAFLNAQRGQWDTWTASLPSGISPRGTWGGTPLVNGAAAAGAATVAIDGLTPSGRRYRQARRLHQVQRPQQGLPAERRCRRQRLRAGDALAHAGAARGGGRQRAGRLLVGALHADPRR